MSAGSHSSADAAVVTVAVTRKVRPGSEAAFEQALDDFVRRSLDQPGQLGVHVLRPAPGSGSHEYGLLRRFSNDQARDNFYHSPLFAEWSEKVAPLVEGEPQYQTVTGLEGWFTLPGQRVIVPPPRWKMAVATLLGVYPTSLFLGLGVAPFLHPLPTALRSLVIAACMVALLTWVVMPNVTKLLRTWLHPHS
ncbi:MAG: antibiotic biosynthesis monooxygenase [Verrucomicrobiota bacterium]|nr:antibiotic biosynthesis monooxygenase [Verrucomicrobiota bacterium]